MRASALLRLSLLALAVSSTGGFPFAAEGMREAQDESSAALPKRAPGLWRITTLSPEIGMQTNDVCIEDGDSIVGPPDSRCAQPAVTRAEDQIIVTIECRSGDKREVASLLFTGDFRSWYRAQSKITLAGPQFDERRSGFAIDARFLSAECGTGAPD